MNRTIPQVFFCGLVLIVIGSLLAPPVPATTSAETESSSKASAFSLDARSDGGGRSEGGGFSGDRTVIERDSSGQFHIQARVNGEDTEFLVDTGADIVALTVEDAERLGIRVAADDFRPIMQTASGEGNAAVVRIDRLELGDDEFRDVDAVVAEGLPVNLLGQSVLRRFGKVELQGDRMVIEHR